VEKVNQITVLMYELKSEHKSFCKDDADLAKRVPRKHTNMAMRQQCHHNICDLILLFVQTLFNLKRQRPVIKSKLKYQVICNLCIRN